MKKKLDMNNKQKRLKHNNIVIINKNRSIDSCKCHNQVVIVIKKHEIR